jgi:hypothetical protein
MQPSSSHPQHTSPLAASILHAVFLLLLLFVCLAVLGFELIALHVSHVSSHFLLLVIFSDRVSCILSMTTSDHNPMITICFPHNWDYRSKPLCTIPSCCDSNMVCPHQNSYWGLIYNAVVERGGETLRCGNFRNPLLWIFSQEWVSYCQSLAPSVSLCMCPLDFRLPLWAEVVQDPHKKMWVAKFGLAASRTVS